MNKESEELFSRSNEISERLQINTAAGTLYFNLMKLELTLI